MFCTAALLQAVGWFWVRSMDVQCFVTGWHSSTALPFAVAGIVVIVAGFPLLMMGALLWERWEVRRACAKSGSKYGAENTGVLHEAGTCGQPLERPPGARSLDCGFMRDEYTASAWMWEPLTNVHIAALAAVAIFGVGLPGGIRSERCGEGDRDSPCSRVRIHTYWLPV